jgi:FPC/CPF motif-containing protein YcgG
MQPSQEWEFSFTPNPAITTCDHCGQKHIAESTIVAIIHFGTTTKQFHYCGQSCREEHYLQHLRRAGL